MEGHKLLGYLILLLTIIDLTRANQETSTYTFNPLTEWEKNKPNSITVSILLLVHTSDAPDIDDLTFEFKPIESDDKDLFTIDLPSDPITVNDVTSASGATVDATTSQTSAPKVYVGELTLIVTVHDDTLPFGKNLSTELWCSPKVVCKNSRETVVLVQDTQSEWLAVDARHACTNYCTVLTVLVEDYKSTIPTGTSEPAKVTVTLVKDLHTSFPLNINVALGFKGTVNMLHNSA